MREKLTNLFQLGDFTLHSGEKSTWKIDCNYLTDEDWETLAFLAFTKLPKFEEIYSVPTGGDMFARKLCRYEIVHPYAKRETKVVLIADDVYTTGTSMEAKKKELLTIYPEDNILGVVVFARKPTPFWIKALFTLYQN